MSVPRTPDFDRERLYTSVDLVSRVGNRSQRELCVMSLVALMAGERHSDRPDCACPVITAFAIKLNDALDDDARQKLKPFAPRIIGTRDGYTAERARFLVDRILRDVVPRLLTERCREPRAVLRTRLVDGEHPHDAAQRIIGVMRRDIRAEGFAHGSGSDLRYLLRAYGRESHQLVATAAAVLLANCARLGDGPHDRQWFWNYATDLLDRACDVGISATRSVAEIERMSQMAAAGLQAAALRANFGLSRRRRISRLFGSEAD
jgi:hypothetical protein